MCTGGKRVRVVTMGCSKNRVDSEHLLKQLSAAGYEVSPEEVPLEDAGVDILIINTCGFILDAKEESVQAILEAVDAKKRGVIRKLYVMGCLSERYRDELPAEIPEVDGFFGAFSIDPLLQELSVRKDPALETRRYLTTPGHYAYLKISEGCDRHCSYCAIPGIRGPHVSVPEEKLLDEARSLADSGVKELIVIAQDTTFYGLDLYGQRRLGRLLTGLNDIPGVEWIRLLYAYPAAFPQDHGIFPQDVQVPGYSSPTFGGPGAQGHAPLHRRQADPCPGGEVPKGSPRHRAQDHHDGGTSGRR